jgi:hypothetical protein
MDTTGGRIVTTRDELVAAVDDAGVAAIAVVGRIGDVPTLRLRAGQRLRGDGADAAIVFAPGADGLALTSDNALRNIGVYAAPEYRAIFNDTSVRDLGRIELAGVTTTGQVQILARDGVRAGHVEIDGLDIVAADVRDRPDRPRGFGVEVLQGAFALWNMQNDDSVSITADLVGLSAGRVGAPALGGGIFVSGAGPDGGGRVNVRRLETDALYTDGKIVFGTADRITGGVFTSHGAHVEVVRNRGPVVTYGSNDIVLDNWGVVSRWIVNEKISSFGPIGIGFVNFGTIAHLKVDAPIETFGDGARGFNVYAGTVGLAEFDRIATHGDGAAGMQFDQPIGRLCVRRGIETFGGIGPTLVKGVIVQQPAIALSIRPGGAAQEIVIEGGVVTHGAGMLPIEMLGSVQTLRVTGGFEATGGGLG